MPTVQSPNRDEEHSLRTDRSLRDMTESKELSLYFWVAISFPQKTASVQLEIRKSYHINFDKYFC